MLDAIRYAQPQINAVQLHGNEQRLKRHVDKGSHIQRLSLKFDDSRIQLGQL